MTPGETDHICPCGKGTVHRGVRPDLREQMVLLAQHCDGSAARANKSGLTLMAAPYEYVAREIRRIIGVRSP